MGVAQPKPIKKEDTSAIAAELAQLKEMVMRLANNADRTETPQAFSECTSEVFKLLVSGGMEESVATELCRRAQSLSLKSGESTEDVVRCLAKNLLGTPRRIEAERFQTKPVLFLGPTGVGKTTTLVKLAYQLIYEEKLSVGIINTDVFRVAAVEHLRAYCDILKTELITIQRAEEMKDALQTMEDKDIVLIDTAEKVATDEAYAKEMKTLIESGGIKDVFVMMSAATDKEVRRAMLAQYAKLGDFQLIVTKMDEVCGCGVLFSIAKESGKPICYLTTGQNVPDDICMADAEAALRGLL